MYHTKLMFKLTFAISAVNQNNFMCDFKLILISIYFNIFISKISFQKIVILLRYINIYSNYKHLCNNINNPRCKISMQYTMNIKG